MSAPVRLWFAIEVVAFEEAVAFYRDALGLLMVDGWNVDNGDGDTSRGVVFAVGESARIEIESAPAPGRTPVIALELPDLGALTTLYERLAVTEPISRHDRGHQHFTTHDPSGTEIYLWSEK